MSEQQDQPQAQGAQDERQKAPPKPRPKMTLDEQACFLASLLERCKMHGPELRGDFAGVAMLTLDTDDMLRLETVWQTLRVFDLHRADQMVRDKIMRRRK